ncbi:MAG: pantetheine-phosphate adenylyltransferase [Telluria sp.]
MTSGTRGPRVAVYPGSFDPITNGHVDIIERGSRLFDRIVVAVLVNAEKHPLFTPDERVAIIREVFKEYPNIQIETFDGLLVEYARRRRASAIVRGIRAVSDFEYEFQMAGMNRYLLPDVETMFLTPSDQYQFISGTIVREIAMLGGDVSKFVFPSVDRWLQKKIATMAPPTE